MVDIAMQCTAQICNDDDEDGDQDDIEGGNDLVHARPLCTCEGSCFCRRREANGGNF